MFFIQVVRGRPGGRLQFSGGGSKIIIIIIIIIQRFNSVLLHDTLPVDLPDL